MVGIEGIPEVQLQNKSQSDLHSRETITKLAEEVKEIPFQVRIFKSYSTHSRIRKNTLIRRLSGQTILDINESNELICT